MTEKLVQTYTADIHMAGDINAAALIIQKYASGNGMCVTLSPQSYIYTGGREEGFRVGFINYPKFPKEPGKILGDATKLARLLLAELGQHSYTIVTNSGTIWHSQRDGHLGGRP